MKKRRGSVLWRWTWYIAQPGSFRDCSVSFANKPATSDSRPLFAIHVTASTTIACSRFAISGRLRCDRPHHSLRRPALVLTLCQSSDFLSCQYSQFCNEIIYKNGLLTTRTGGDHANPRRGLCFQEREILASRFWQLVHLGDSLSGSLPSRHPVVNTFDPIIAAGVCRYVAGCLAIDFVTHTNWNFGQLIEDIKLRHHQPGNSVYRPCIAQQRQIEPAGAPGTPSNGAVLIAARAQQVTGRVEHFAGKRTTADAGAVRLGYTNYGVDGRRRDASSSDSAARSCAGRSHEGIRAMVNVQHRSLRALEDDGFSGSQCLVQQRCRVANKWSDLRRGLRVLLIHFVRIERLRVEECMRDHILLATGVFDMNLQQFEIEQIGNPEPTTPHLVFVRGANPARSSPNFHASRSIL